MNELERLETALRNAHAAGDTAAARRFAAAIRDLRAAVPAPASARPGPADLSSAPTLPAVTVTPDPSRYGAGRVYRRAEGGPLLYDSPVVGPDGKRATHRLSEIVPRLRPGQTVDEYEQETIARAANVAPIPAVRDLEALQEDVRPHVERLLAEARAAGVNLTVGETLRSQDRQDTLFRQGRGGGGSPVTWTLTSNHTPGRAADLVASSPAGYRWIQENAPRFGFRVLGASDPGHIEMPAAAPTARPRQFAGDSVESSPPPAAPISPALAAALAGGHAPPPTTPRAEGAASVEGLPALAARDAARNQGIGSAFFGAGTPLTAAAEYIARALPGGKAPLSPGEAMEFARGRREALQEAQPGAYNMGIAQGVVLGAGPARAVAGAAAKAAPRLANVFALQAGQTARNVARLAAAGGAASGVTAAGEQGVEAVPGAAGAGAVLAPAAVGVGALAVGGARLAGSYIRPDNAALRILARHIDEPVDRLALRYNEFVRTMGRVPRLVEIVRRSTAEEMGQISRVRSRAGEIFRNAEEAAALSRPEELAAQLRGGRAITSDPAQEALLPRPAEFTSALRGPRATEADVRASLPPIRDEATDLLGRRVQSTETAQLGRRDVQLDRLMQRIGMHRVPLTPDMLEIIQHPDVWNSLDPALRRRVAGAIEQGEDIGTVDLTVRTWDAIRQDLASRAGAGSGQIYARLRDRVRDYVSAAVPEYGRGLQEYGRRTDVARGTTAGRRALTEDAREFADRLRTAGGGTDDAARRPGVRAAEQAGMRVGARTALANQLSGTEEQARRALTRLAGDRRLQRNLRAVLGDDEMRELEAIASRYGFTLRLAESTRAGQRLVTRGDDEALAAALRAQRTVAGPRGVSEGARAELAAALEGSEDEARRMMERLATDDAYRNRVVQALSPDEAEALARIGARYGRRLAVREGVALGRKVTQTSDTEAFRDAVAQASSSRPGAVGVQTGARSAVVDAAVESPGSAAETALRLAQDPGFRQRLEVALSGGEAARMERIGATSVTAARRLAVASPGGTSQAQTKAREAAETTQQIIMGAVVATGRASGAFRANLLNSIVQRTRLSKKAAARLAEMATDPAQAAGVIARLRAMGYSADAVREMYLSAAVAAGLLTGQE